MKKFFKAIWNGWKKFGRALARINSEIILFLFYFIIFVPFGFMAKIFGHDPLNLKTKKKSNWRDIKIGAFSRENATRQS